MYGTAKRFVLRRIYFNQNDSDLVADLVSDDWFYVLNRPDLIGKTLSWPKLQIWIHMGVPGILKY